MWQAWMHDRLEYRDGVFYTKKGKVAGYHSKAGYHVITLRGKRYLRHRLVWSMANGPIPEGGVIDHRDGVPGNDWAGNLRLTDDSGNLGAGSPCLVANNTSGYNGVTWRKDCERWQAQCRQDGRRKHVGYFKSAEAAHAALVAYKAANGIEESRRL